MGTGDRRRDWRQETGDKRLEKGNWRRGTRLETGDGRREKGTGDEGRETETGTGDGGRGKTTTQDRRRYQAKFGRHGLRFKASRVRRVIGPFARLP